MNCMTRRPALASFCLFVLCSATHLHAQGTSVTPTTLSFGSQLVGTTSAQMLTVKNTGTASITVTSVTITSVTPPPPATAPFTAGMNCVTKIAAGKSCTFNVRFAPTAMGQVSATLKVNFAAPVATQTASLSGTGIAPVATVSATSLAFGNQQEGTTSGAQQVTLTNTGTAPLTVNNIGVGGTNPANFAQTNTCGNTTGATFPATLGVGAPPCTITVTFTPNATGTRAANLSISVAQPATSQTVSLSGTGVAPSATLLPSPVAFGSQADGTATSMPVTLSNTSSGPLTVTSIGISESSSFTQTNSCGATPATVTTSCTINVFFKPSTTGAKSATLSVSIRYRSTPLTVSLTGTGTTGTGTPPTFTSASSATFIVGLAGSFTPAASGSPTPTITESGTLPSGVTFNGGVLSGTPTVAGVFQITFTATNTTGTTTQSFTLTVNKGTATVTLSNLTQTYTGSSLTPAATTVPAGLAIMWTGAPDTNASTYPVTATVNSPNYVGSASGSFVINKAAATVTLSSLTQTYTGSALTPTATTVPAGLTTTWLGAPDTNAGTYAVTATVSNPNYTGTASGSFVISPAAATVTLGNLAQTYTGSALTPTVTTFPTGVTTTLTGAPDTNAGTYPVTATVSNPNYTGTASGSFVISQATPVITWSTPAAITSGTALSGTQLDAIASVPGAFVYSPPAGTIPAVGADILSVTFTARDTTDYSTTTASVMLTVNAAASLTSIAVTPASSSVVVGSTQQFTATGTYSDNSTQPLTSATWSSSASAVATISSTGLATAMEMGTTTISATLTGISGSAPLTVVGTGGTTPTDSMAFARDPFTSTLLNDGTILMAGGYASPGVAQNTTDFYDSAGHIIPLKNPSMVSARAYHTATLLNSGMVLLVGGYDATGTPLASAELYDPNTGSFSATTGSLATARTQHTATLLSDGTVLIAGGSNTTQPALATGELYDPVSQTFIAVGSLTTARYQHTATLLNDGTVLIAGGVIDRNYTPTPTAEIYYPLSANPALSTFSSIIPGMNSPRAYHTATLLNDGTVLIVGGTIDKYPHLTATAETYDPSSGSFNLTTGSMATPRATHTATLLNNGQVLIAGGAVNGNGPLPPIGAPTSAMELYAAGSFSPPTDSLGNTTTLNTARSEQTATLLSNGSVLFAGGVTDTAGTPTNAAELYLPPTLRPQVSPFIAVSPANLTTVPLGTTQRFIATDTNTGQRLVSVTWMSSDTTIAVVGNDTGNPGLAHFVGMGQVTISACAGVCGSTTFSVGPAALVSIGLIPANPAIPDGTSQPFSAKGIYTDNSSQDLTALVNWSSSATGVATIDATGLATASSAGCGTAVITATSADGSVSGSATLTALTGAVGGGWGCVANLNTGRGHHTATMLNNGLILIAGGFTNGPITASAELYDTKTGIFTPTGSMKFPRADHDATMLDNGMVLITGGYNTSGGNPLAGAELYDPVAGTFSLTTDSSLNPTNLNVARALHTATLLNDGTILIVGGAIDNLGVTPAQTAELYNPATGLFTYTTNVPNDARFLHTATLLNDGTVLVAGGQNPNGSLGSAEVYDPATGAFTVLGSSLVYARGIHTATLLNGGTVLIAGGVNGIQGSGFAPVPYAEVYTSNGRGLGNFAVSGPLSTSRFDHTATLLNNGTVLVAGGLSFSVSVTPSVELFDPANGTFGSGGALATPRGYHTATRLNDGTVLITGGDTFSTPFEATVSELYSPATWVPPGVTAITVTNGNQTITVGNSVNFTAVDSNGQSLASVTWTSSNTSVAQISNDVTNSGVAVGLSAGTATITACTGPTICSAHVTLTVQ